ncbi:aspartyl protease family protein [Pedobacter sp. ASV28]|uniref:aspartyl protease family protein n=1 Tax=Pedobacter sp. ASV28 TaxID=2795123 RepID=UPI0018EB0BDF|nr:aspartyl protease family protein [Pedobacter sp. ASV28]
MNSTQAGIHFKFFHFILALLCVFLLFINNAQAQKFEFTNGRKQQSISFELIKNLIIIPIYINEKGPFNFILDTGVSPMIITDPALRESLKINYPRPIKISGYGNFEGIDAYLTSLGVKIGDAEIGNMPSVFLKEDLLNLSGFVGKKIYGLIGYNFFNSFVVKINYSNKIIKYSLPEKKVSIKGEKIPLTFIENKPYIHLGLEQEGFKHQTIKALVDCGATHTLSLESWQSLAFPKPAITIDANLGVGLTGEIKGRMGRASKLTIGSVSLKDVITSYPEYVLDSLQNKDRNANIGAEILSRFNIVYDYQNGYMYLKKNDAFNRPFEHDMAGIEIYSEQGPPSRYMIARIEKESPAQQVGLQEGDEITGINFKKIDTYNLDEIGAIFKAKNGYSVLIEIWRNNSYLIKLLKLKKRI